MTEWEEDIEALYAAVRKKLSPHLYDNDLISMKKFKKLVPRVIAEEGRENIGTKGHSLKEILLKHARTSPDRFLTQLSKKLKNYPLKRPEKLPEDHSDPEDNSDPMDLDFSDMFDDDKSDDSPSYTGLPDNTPVEVTPQDEERAAAAKALYDGYLILLKSTQQNDPSDPDSRYDTHRLFSEDQPVRFRLGDLFRGPAEQMAFYTEHYQAQFDTHEISPARVQRVLDLLAETPQYLLGALSS